VTPPAGDAMSTGIRVLSGHNSGDYLVTVAPDGLTYSLGADLGTVPAVIELDPGSLVLTTFGRLNAGTIRGDKATAGTFLNSFFRI
jgi:hypothetical protein